MFFPDKVSAEKIIKKYSAPVFVTDRKSLDNQVQLIKKHSLENIKIFYAVKANYNPSIIKTLKKSGIDGIDAVSPFEIELAKRCGFAKKQIIFTGNNSGDDELREIFRQGITPNIGSLSELERFGNMFNGSDISIRFNSGIGAGESKYVVTGGSKSKFGILEEDIKEVKNIIEKYSLNVIGIHSHIGSGFYKAKVFKRAVRSILKIASNFRNLEFVDLGGGFGVRYDPKATSINLEEFFTAIKNDIKEFVKNNGRPIDVIIEPGKFLVAESTCLLTKVTNIKNNGSTVFIGTDTGINHIIRPALYSAYHHIINISNPKASQKKVTIVGNICESSDVLCKDIKMPLPVEGDILAILTAGAYCASMSSLYNLRPYAPEVLFDNGKITEIRRSLDFNQTLSGLGFSAL